MEPNRDIRIPADSILALRRTLVREMGAQAVAPALQRAGYAAGDALFQRFARVLPEDVGATSATGFWKRLDTMFRELGWGSVEHAEVHPGVGALIARQWFEADGGAASCVFSTGVLANLLGRVAGDDVAVMQVPCEDDEPNCARFLFGAAPVLQEVYAALRDGADLHGSLATLG